MRKCDLKQTYHRHPLFAPPLSRNANSFCDKARDGFLMHGHLSRTMLADSTITRVRSSMCLKIYFVFSSAGAEPHALQCRLKIFPSVPNIVGMLSQEIV